MLAEHRKKRIVEEARRAIEEIEALLFGSRAPGAAPFDRAISFTRHDSCHLVHGQKMSAQPRALLRQLPGVTVVELTESTLRN